MFSVDSLNPVGGAFGGGYQLGDQTVGPVEWVSDSQSGSGAVTFSKTIYVGGPTQGTGSLGENATLKGACSSVRKERTSLP